MQQWAEDDTMLSTSSSSSEYDDDYEVDTKVECGLLPSVEPDSKNGGGGGEDDTVLVLSEDCQTLTVTHDIKTYAQREMAYYLGIELGEPWIRDGAASSVVYGMIKECIFGTSNNNTDNGQIRHWVEKMHAAFGVHVYKVRARLGRDGALRDSDGMRLLDHIWFRSIRYHEMTRRWIGWLSMRESYRIQDRRTRYESSYVVTKLRGMARAMTEILELDTTQPNPHMLLHKKKNKQKQRRAPRRGPPDESKKLRKPYKRPSTLIPRHDDKVWVCFPSMHFPYVPGPVEVVYKNHDVGVDAIIAKHSGFSFSFNPERSPTPSMFTHILR